jgi:phage baseplate assembly protein gpV
MSLDPHLAETRRQGEKIARLEALIERMVRPGKVAAVDFSNPTKPRARIAHGKKKDGSDALGPWLPWSSHAGEATEWKPVTVGQQMMQFAPDGVFENGLLLPYSFSMNIPSPSTDQNTHVSQYGQQTTSYGKDHFTRTVGGSQVHTDTKDHKVTTPQTIMHAAGDPAAAESGSSMGSLGQAPHELNRQLQGLEARVANTEHQTAALHDTMSTLNTIAMTKIPALANIAYKLNNSPTGLVLAQNDVMGQAPAYIASAITQAVSRLSNTLLGSVMETVQGNSSEQLSGLLSQLGTQLGGAGLSADAAATANNIIAQAQAAIPSAAAGGGFELGAQLASLSSLTAGSPAASLIAPIVAQIQGAMSSTSSLMSGLSGLLDGQVNLTKGTTKSYLLGGYSS